MNFSSLTSLHSIGLILLRRRKADAFRKFITDMTKNAGITVALLAADEIEVVADYAASFNLDFDDAYQLCSGGKVQSNDRKFR